MNDIILSFRLRANRWRLVAQSGHTNEYCDGSHHVISEGGWAGLSQPKTVRYLISCNCRVYAESEHRHEK